MQEVPGSNPGSPTIFFNGIGRLAAPTAFSITFNWNPSYSYAKIPAGLTSIPDYDSVLAEGVPREKGIPHLKNVRISNLKASGSREAFSVSSYPDSPLQSVTFLNIDIQAQRAGTIQNAENWTFENMRIQTADGSLRCAKGISPSNRVAGAVNSSSLGRIY